MRWTCCDKKESGTWGSSGCKTRCHFPPFEGHPKLVDIVRKVRMGVFACFAYMAHHATLIARPPPTESTLWEPAVSGKFVKQTTCCGDENLTPMQLRRSSNKVLNDQFPTR